MLHYCLQLQNYPLLRNLYSPSLPSILQLLTFFSSSPYSSSSSSLSSFFLSPKLHPSASIPVTLRPLKWWTCDSTFVSVREVSPINGNPEGSYEISYRPLLIATQPVDALLTISTKELGTFKYKLILTAAPLISRESLRFEIPLGGTQTQLFVFRAFNSIK